MRLEPLYRIRFTYPESWAVGLDGGRQQMFFLAEGRCEGWVTGRFRGANFPQKRGAEGPFRPDFRAVIEVDDGAVIMVEWHGYGRTYPPGRRQIVGSVFHQARPRALPPAERRCLRLCWRGPRPHRPGSGRTGSCHGRRRADLGAHRRLTHWRAVAPAEAGGWAAPPWPSGRPCRNTHSAAEAEVS
jgi:hypothetical protein